MSLGMNAGLEPWVRAAVLSAGGVLGVNARYWLGLVVARVAAPGFPWATVLINVSGSFAIGFLAAAVPAWTSHPYARLFVVVGFLGGYTTFSSFSYETMALLERGRFAPAFANAAGSVVAGLVAVILGAALARGLLPATVDLASPAAAGAADVPEEVA